MNIVKNELEGGKIGGRETGWEATPSSKLAGDNGI